MRFNVRLLGVVIFAAGCADHEPTRGADALMVMAGHWHAPFAVSAFPHPACDTIRLAAPQTQCSAPSAPPSLPALRQVAEEEARLSERYTTDASADVAHELGLIQLVSASDTAAVDRAITLLRQAAVAEPARANVAVDLSAALLLRYTQRRALPDLLEATEVSAAFARVSPADSRACWNFMVALSWLAAREQISRARTQCQSSCEVRNCSFPQVVDESPAPQADPLSIALDGRWTDAAWDHATLKLMPQWAASLREGRADSAILLRAQLMRVHEALLARGADSSIGLAIAQVDSAPPGSVRRNALLRAALLYPESRASASVNGPRSAVALLDSIRSLTQSTDQLRLWAEMHRANLALMAGRPTEARRAYQTLGAGRRSPSTVVGGRLAFNTGLAIMAQGDQIGGLQRVESQGETCQAVARAECATAVFAMAAGIASEVGDSDRSDQNLQRALESSIGPLRSSRWSLLSALRQTAELYGFLSTAGLLHQEARFVAHQLRRPDLEAQELLMHAMTRLRVGDTAAIPLITQELRPMIRDQLRDADQAFFLADLTFIEGEYRLLTGRRGARALLDSAIRQMSSDTNSVRQLRPRLSFARAIAQEGDTLHALLALDSLLRSLSRRSGVGATIFERARLADDAAAAGLVAAALLRPREDHGALLRALSAQPFLDAALPSLHRDASRLDVAVRRVGDTVFVWSNAGGDWSMRSTYLPEIDVRTLQAAMDTTRLSELFDALVAPVLSTASGSIEGMRVDARGDLAAIPWAALYDRRERRFLIERFAVWHTDDVWQEPTADVRVATSRTLVIDAAPRHGGRALPGAEREVGRVQAIWGPRSERFDASEGAERTLTRMPHYDVVHFAGHAVLDAQRPDRSYLELPGVSSARITGLHLSKLSLTRTSLVVLAACDTRGDHVAVTRGNRGAARSSGGLQSLAHAFLAAGAAQVIGAAWEIDDAVTSTIIAHLHESLRAGHPPVRALREAQLKAIQSTDPARQSPRVWAAFQLLGS